MFSRDKIAAVVAEIVGTGVLTFVFLSVSKSPLGLPYFISLAVAIALGLLVLVLGPISGAHVNPAITIGRWTLRQVTTIRAIVYVAAQFLGAVLAWQLFTYLTARSLASVAGKFDWRVMVAELVGTFVFAMGVAAATFQRPDTGRKAAIIGGSLFLGALIASVASNAMLNPAIALGAQSWNAAYVAGPIVGSVLGMNFYVLFFAPASALNIRPSSATKVLGLGKSKSTSSKNKK